MFRRFTQEVIRCPHEGNERHDRPLPDGIDGRVGNLGKQLLEVVAQVLALLRQYGQRDVRTHGAQRFLARFDHGRQDHPQVFGGKPEGLLHAQQLGRIVIVIRPDGGFQILKS